MTSSENLLPLPRYIYVGPDATNTAIVECADNYLRTNKPEIEATEITDHPYSGQFDAMNQSIKSLGQDLGLELSDRVRTPEYFHLYSDDEYATVREQFQLRVGSVAINFTSGHMLAKEEETELSTLANFNHEVVHVASRKLIFPKTTMDRDNVTTVTPHNLGDGYLNYQDNIYDTINEVIIEMTNIDLIRNYWPENRALEPATQESYGNVGYLSEVIFFDELLKESVPDPRETFKKIQRGLFLGDMTQLHNISELVDHATLGKIATIDPTKQSDTLALADSLGLEKAITKIQRRSTEDLVNWL